MEEKKKEWRTQQEQVKAKAVSGKELEKSFAVAPANKVNEKCMASLFRMINEKLYTMTGEEAERFFKMDAFAFHAYHAGYKEQVVFFTFF